MARLTPLGCTCIGNIGSNKQTNTNTNFTYTYFSAGQQDMERINLMLQNFWETNTSGIEKGSLFKTDERAVLDMAERSITCNDRCYRIPIPWK